MQTASNQSEEKVNGVPYDKSERLLTEIMMIMKHIIICASLRIVPITQKMVKKLVGFPPNPAALC